MKIQKIVDKNNNLRNQIYETANLIEKILSNDLLNMSKDLEIKDEKTLIIETFPVSQQIEIYKKSINKLKLSTNQKSKEILAIEEIENKIKALKQSIYRAKEQNKILEKSTKNQKQILGEVLNTKQGEKELSLPELEKKYKELKVEFRKVKDEYKMSNVMIDKQRKIQFILEDNCDFIKENIDFYKARNSLLNKNALLNLNDLEEKAKGIEEIKKDEQNKYNLIIKQQLYEIKKLEDAHQFLENKIEECWREHKRQQLKIV